MSGYSITKKNKGFKVVPCGAEWYPTIKEATARAAELQAKAKRTENFGVCRWERAFTASGASYQKMIPVSPTGEDINILEDRSHWTDKPLYEGGDGGIVSQPDWRYAEG